MADSDTELIARCLKNDAGAFEKLLDENKNPIFGLILRMVRNQQDAQDLAQETFLKAFRNLQSYKPEYPLRTWLYRIAHNACVDFLRARKAPAFPLDSGEGPEIPDENESPETAVEIMLQQEQAEALIASLPPLYAEILLLHYREDLTGPQIAEILQIPEGTVKVRLFRARNMARLKLR